MRRFSISFLTLALALPRESPAQRPDLTGTWVLVADSGAAAPSVASVGDAAFRRGDMGSGWGTPLTIKQDEKRVIVEFPQFSAYDLQPPVVLTFALDGSGTMNTINPGRESVDLRSTAEWSGATLVITTAYPGPAGPDARRLMMNVRQALSLEAPTVLVLETTRPGLAGGPPSTIRTTYRRR